MSSAEGRRAGGMWLKGLDISSDFLGYTVSGDSQIAGEDGFNSATREVGEGSGVDWREAGACGLGRRHTVAGCGGRRVQSRVMRGRSIVCSKSSLS